MPWWSNVSLRLSVYRHDEVGSGKRGRTRDTGPVREPCILRGYSSSFIVAPDVEGEVDLGDRWGENVEVDFLAPIIKESSRATLSMTSGIVDGGAMLIRSRKHRRSTACRFKVSMKEEWGIFAPSEGNRKSSTLQSASSKDDSVARSRSDEEFARALLVPVVSATERAVLRSSRFIVLDAVPGTPSFTSLLGIPE
ncbi:uncharacterized protein BT62DRAFT_919033 [Guyanagaster necrorhizus]|uniref:Uncharacterized protein n=1 Tax=Guyanagaster necrorhizus TaxID=856835 RepID=A0A9P7VUY7_9AGAR|nr:uncharacterized protein BT62DRAFT_919033 [Guyanagaster necrorhizus MCA 3950]KAG7447838.1 hypothetical protein BT62DRAFT_919033 [Guyanagaster necrorhizus MCA 3950]